MGNRAVIAFASDETGKTVEPYAIYLHWNGGPESVYAFCDYAAKVASDRFPGDQSYGMARLVQIIGNFMGGTMSLGIFDLDPKHPEKGNGDQGDNGLYVIGKGQNGKGYSMLKRHCRYPARWLTAEEIAAEEASARKHAYFAGDEPIDVQIAKANDQFFVNRD